MNIEQEKSRLAKLVFEGADDVISWAVKSCTGWVLFNTKQVIDSNTKTNWVPWIYGQGVHYSKNQPKTPLCGTETLLKRSDYE